MRRSLKNFPFIQNKEKENRFIQWHLKHEEKTISPILADYHDYDPHLGTTFNTHIQIIDPILKRYFDCQHQYIFFSMSIEPTTFYEMTERNTE